MQIPRRGEAERVNFKAFILDSKLLKNQRKKRKSPNAASLGAQDSSASQAWTCLPDQHAGTEVGLWTCTSQKCQHAGKEVLWRTGSHSREKG